MRTTLNPHRIMAVCLVTLLSACGGGGSSSSSSSSAVATPQGVYYGTGKFASGGGNNTLMLVESDNTYWILYTPPSAPFSTIFIENGTADATAVTFTISADTEYDLLYDDPASSNAIVPSGATAGAVITGYTGQLDYTYQKQIDGSIFNGKTVISVIGPLYVAGSTTMGSLTTIAGNYTGNISSTLNSSTLQAAACTFSAALSIGSNGKVTGTLTDCTGSGLPSNSTVTGTLTPRTDIDAFDLTLTFTGDGSQPLDGLTFDGIAYYNASRKQLNMAALTSDHKTAIGFVAVGP